MQTTDFVATIFDGRSNPNKVTVTFIMALNALLKGHTATIILMVEAVELDNPARPLDWTSASLSNPLPICWRNSWKREVALPSAARA